MHKHDTAQPTVSSHASNGGILNAVRRWFDNRRINAEWDKAAEANENLNRIDRIPYAVLSESSPARVALVALAIRGHDVDAYTPVASQDWRIWCRPAHPSMQGRYTIAEWEKAYASEFARIVGAQKNGSVRDGDE